MFEYATVLRDPRTRTGLIDSGIHRFTQESFQIAFPIRILADRCVKCCSLSEVSRATP